ncbi:MAG: sodium:calcium antiporter [Acidimicrobiia bacterium]
MTFPILLVLGGLVLLSLSADRFVVSATRLARHWGMSPLLVGAVVVGMGTSLPELLVSISGGLDSFDLGIGNITGSNIANLTLVLGVAVVISPLAGSREVAREEGLLTLLAMTIFSALLWDGTLTRLEGAVLLVAMAGALTRLFLVERRKQRQLAEAELWIGDDVADPTASEEPDEVEGRVWTELGLAIVTLTAMLLGANWLTDGALGIAEVFGLSAGFVGNSLVAIGTSLPELAAVVAAARRREHDLILGNLLGSNVFNSLLVAGALGVTTGGSLVDASTLPLTIGFMMGSIILAGTFAARNVISRLEGLVLLAFYGSFLWFSY